MSKHSRTILVAIGLIMIILMGCLTTDGSNSCPLGTHWVRHEPVPGYVYYTCEPD